MYRTYACFVFVAFCLLIGLQTVSSAHEGHHPHEHSAQDSSKTEGKFFTTRDVAKVLPLAKEEDVFHFVIFGDRTGGVPAGLRILEQAVEDTNLLDPDLVMTVGDLVQGYNDTPEWLTQMTEYKQVMDGLKMQWFPVAGNHDIYWRGQGDAPEGHHESDYEQHFGPLWYSFAHKNAGFIVLFSDEGDPATNEKSFHSGRLQMMSDQQLEFLEQSLEKHKDLDHVFLFLHHPRWIGGGYDGSNWDVVHNMLKRAGNVTAVFAGHIHRMRFDAPDADDPSDKILYFTLGATGGALSADIPGAGYLHHLNLVTVRPGTVSVSALAVGAVIDPKSFTPEFLDDINRARQLRPVTSEELQLQIDGSAAGSVNYRITNPSQRPIEITASFDPSGSGWTSSLDHSHFTLPAGQSKEIAFTVHRDAASGETPSIPRLQLDLQYIGETARVQLPQISAPLALRLAAVPADYFDSAENRCLDVLGDEGALRIESSELKLHDGPFTVEAWINPVQAAGNRGIITKTENSEFGFFMNEGVPQFIVHLDGKYKAARAKNVLPADEWTHLAGVFDGERVSLYINGEQVGSTVGKGKRTRNQLPLFIGADPDPRGQPSRSFLGKIDEVRISSTARYHQSFTPEQRHAPDDSTVLLLHMDRQVGPFLLDHSPSATKATLGRQGSLVPR